MNIEEKFQRAYRSLEDTIEKRHQKDIYTALGYTSNLDLLCDFQVEKLNDLLARHMQGKNLREMRIAKKIRTMEELLETIVCYCIHGIGGETDVENTELVRESFLFQNGMGGTAVQAALALAAVGGETLVHLTDDSEEVCEILKSPHIHVVLENGELGHVDQVKARNPQELHFIIQFKKGDIVQLGDQKMEIPCSNRVILTKNTVNEYLPLWDPYFRWIEENAGRVSSNVLSSFNSILDPEILKDRLEYIKKHVEVYRRNNPKGVVYFEDAHYHDENICRLCIESIAPCVDIFSMNEEELQYTLKEFYGYPVNINDICSCAEGAEFLMKKLGIRRGIIIHTKDYAMYVGDAQGIEIEKGLMYGALMATAKALYGSYGNKEQIRDVMKLNLSDQGCRHLRKLEESIWKDRTVLIPTLYLDKPKYTIGLGDSFTGGVQMCF